MIQEQRTTHESRRARTAYLWVGVILPLAIFALAGVVIAMWLPQAPNPSATHWGVNGQPDGFGAPWINLAVPIGLGVGLVLLFGGISWASMRVPQRAAGPVALRTRSQDPSMTVRLLGAVSLGLSAMMSFIGLVVVGSQRGLADAQDAPDISGATFVGFGLLVVLAVAGWFVQPAPPKPVPHDGPGAAPLPLADGARAVWFGTATLSKAGVATLSVLLFGTLALGVGLVAAGAAGGWFAVAVSLLMIVLMLTTSVFRVRADATGLHVRSTFGWPRYDISAGEIAAVRVVAVNPFAEFGGWGIRWGLDGRFGIVLRAGEGIEVTRENGKIMVVTVDDAETAAAVLSAAASTTKDNA